MVPLARKIVYEGVCSTLLRMVIDLVVSDFSSHRVARTYCVGEVLAMDHEVRYWGISSEDRLWKPLAEELREAEVSSRRRFPGALSAMKEMAGRMDGDVLYAFKPLVDSFGLALLAKRMRPRPLILDIDDWEWAFSLSKGKWFILKKSLTRLTRTSSPAWVWVMERLISKADAITTVSTVFQRKYGGVLLPHGRDPQRLDPALFDPIEERRRLELPQEPVLLFLGTPRPHKGLEELMDAVMQLRRDFALCPLLVGGEPSDPFVQSLVKRTQGSLQVRPMCLFSEMPQILAASDLVVLPQREEPRSTGQVPAKLFDAMAMARPIVSTSVSEIPAILGECGWVVPPEDVPALVGAIRQILTDPSSARERGRDARNRFKERYSYSAMRTILRDVLVELGFH